MSTVVVNNKDQAVMKLVHYFVTKENYSPIVVAGAKDEIWLENEKGPYRIIRINSSYIHNSEQYSFDLFKTKNIVKQIKKKTLSLSIDTLNIFLDLNDRVKAIPEKLVDTIVIKDCKHLEKNKKLLDIFPKITKDLLNDKDGIDLIMNITKDINKKTETENKKVEKVFKKKNIVVTNIIIALNVLVFFAMYALGDGSYNTNTLLTFGANFGPLVKAGDYYRLVTCAFIHIGVVHLLFNLYALKIIGSQIENFLGKKKFIIIYLVSSICGSMLSILFSDSISAGASGAIFGLLGSLLYFGYHYRLFLGSVLKRQIIPLILFNLVLGFVLSGVDNAAHIGGLFGGILTTMALGIENKSTKSERINGLIVLLLFIGFMAYMIFR